jgi:cytochrome P450
MDAATTMPPLADKPDHVPADRVIDLDVYAPPGGDKDFHLAWRTVQATSPEIAWTPRHEGHWVALRGDILAEVQSDPDRFSSQIIIVPKSVGAQHGLIPTTIDPPEHRPYRARINPGFTPAAIRALAPKVRALANELIDGVIATGKCNFTEQYAQLFPIRIFMAMVNLPEGDAGQIKYLADCMTRPDGDLTFEQAKFAFFDYVEPIIIDRQAHPGDDMISKMVAPHADGTPFSVDEAKALVTQVLIAGVDTVVNFLSFAIRFIAEHPEHRRQLAHDPASIPMAVSELFRRFGLVSIARTVRNDMEFHGVQLKAGELIAIPTIIHGLDDRINPDPMTVDFNRPRSKHSTFGSGPHICVGQELARSEVIITLTEWLKRIPEFEVDMDASDLSVAPGIVGAIRRLCLKWPAS